MTSIATTLAVPLAQRLLFDLTRGEVRDHDRRYLMMRPDVLMGMLRRLGDDARDVALAAFADATAEHGQRSIQAYLESLPGGGDALLDLIYQTSPALGWGRWDFERLDGGLALNVFNSPFAAGYGVADRPVCAPISGMFRTIAGIVLGHAVQVEEIACAAMQAHATCRFVARPAAGAAVQGAST